MPAVLHIAIARYILACTSGFNQLVYSEVSILILYFRPDYAHTERGIVNFDVHDADKNDAGVVPRSEALTQEVSDFVNVPVKCYHKSNNSLGFAVDTPDGEINMSRTTFPFTNIIGMVIFHISIYNNGNCVS